MTSSNTSHQQKLESNPGALKDGEIVVLDAVSISLRDARRFNGRVFLRSIASATVFRRSAAFSRALKKLS